MDPHGHTSEERSLRSPPFSLAEFSQLVSSALDCDTFTDPVLSFRLSLYSRSQPSLDLADKSISVAAANHSRSPRQIFEELKRRASAFVTRSPTKDRTPAPPFLPLQVHQVTTRIPAVSSLNSLSSWGDDENDYIPYLPLASQYEAESPPPPSISTQTSTPPNQSHRIFSRHCLPSITPSSPSTHSCSSASTSGHSSPVTPITPLFSPSSQSSDRGRRPSIGSLGTDEDDPFAKGNVQIVRSGEQHSPKSSHSPASSSSHLRRKRNHIPLAPITPPPPWPLPSPPCSADVHVQHHRKEVEGTLHLGVPTKGPRKAQLQNDQFEQQTHKESSEEKESSNEDWTLSLPLPCPSRFPCSLSRSKASSSPSSPSPSPKRGRESATKVLRPHARPSPPFPTNSPSPSSSSSRNTADIFFHAAAHSSLPSPDESERKREAPVRKKRSGSPFPLPLGRKVHAGTTEDDGDGMERAFELMIAAGILEDINTYRDKVSDRVDFEAFGHSTASDLGRFTGAEERRGVNGDAASMMSGIYYSARSSLNL